MHRHRLMLLLLCGLAGVLLLLRPGTVPALWYDEGWVLSLARNWVERGHYGHLLLGQPVAAGIPFTGMPAVAPIALSFRLFGVGLWQARLPGILLTAGTLAVFYGLAARLYGRQVATTALAAALLLPMLPDLHVILLGRQALGEMATMLCLLAGFALLQRGWQRPARIVPWAVLLWALALRTKPQVLPFFAASLALPAAWAAWRRNQRTAGLLSAALLGTLAASSLLSIGQDLLLRSPLFAPTSGHELYSWVDNAANYLFTYALVPDLSARVQAAIVLGFALPCVLGILYALRAEVRNRRAVDLGNGRDVCHLALLTFASTGLAWYALFSGAFARYLFPAAFVGTLFLAVFLVEIAGGLDPLRLLRLAAAALRRRALSLRGAGLVVTSVAVGVGILLTPAMLVIMYYVEPDDSLRQAARYLNTHTPAGAVIETYDTELFFLLDRPVHYPPDRVQDELIRRVYLSRGTPVDYDPLAADPDYLVVGHFGRIWELYDAVLETAAFRLTYKNARYSVYERLR